MRWKRGRRSTNIEDRRGKGGGRRMPGGLKLGTGATILVVVVGMLLGGDPMQILKMIGGTTSQVPQGQPAGYTPSAQEQEQAEFVSAVLADTEDTWNPLFAQAGARYQEPKLVLFSGMVQSACGMNTAATGPFYCPGDRKVYIDLSFFRELEKLGAPGDFARAYVIGHEVGHHIQTLQGTERRVRQAQRAASSKAQANQLSVAMELQADCYAGVWAHHAERQRDLLEAGDIEEGLQAAASIGDDRLQSRAGRVAHPDSFTHGSSAQRVEWFKRGLQLGSVESCNTFGS